MNRVFEVTAFICFFLLLGTVGSLEQGAPLIPYLYWACGFMILFSGSAWLAKYLKRKMRLRLWAQDKRRNMYTSYSNISNQEDFVKEA